MKFYHISVNSLKRRKSKTFFLILSLILAVSSIAGLFQVSVLLSNNLESDLDVFGANILITPRTENLSINYGGIDFGNVSFDKSTLHTEDIVKIDSIKNRKNISVVSPKLIQVAKSDSSHVLLSGIEFDKEVKLKKWWKISGGIPEKTNQIILGANISERLNKGIGTKIHINSSLYEVSGILGATGSQDDDMIFMSLPEVQKITGKLKEVSLIELSALCYDCPIEEIVRQTSAQIPGARVTAIKKSIDTKKTTLNKFKNLSAGLSGMILLISILMVFSNVNASLLERTREIGIYKAVGFDNFKILKIVILEIAFAAIIAGLVGYFIGVFLSVIIYSFLTDGGGTIGYQFNFTILLLSTLLSLTVGITAALYPALKSANMDPTVAFRNL